MIKVKSGDIFESEADALVNPVNSRGVMGKGLAREFRKRFPEYLRAYKYGCKAKTLKPGKLQLVKLHVDPPIPGQRWPAVIHFPTKGHWKSQSNLKWIRDGLRELKEKYSSWGLKSVAMPALGTGLGGLKWEDVKRLIHEVLESEPLIVEVYLGALHDHGEIVEKPPERKTKPRPRGKTRAKAVNLSLGLGGRT